MSTIGKAISVLRSFASNQNGTTAITFALSIVPLLLTGGAAIDYMRYSDAQTKIQAALDSGALAVAAAGNLSDPQRIAAGEQSFNSNLATLQIDAAGANVDFQLSGKTVMASAHYELASGFMQIAGLTTMTVNVSTEISIPESKSAEVALVLDYSGSMTEEAGGEVKYVAMKNAAKKLISDLEASNPNKVKIGLVPFSHHVYVTLPEGLCCGAIGHPELDRLHTGPPLSVQSYRRGSQQ